MPENQTVWKSNNQGVKEETFIQTGRKAGQAAGAERTLGNATYPTDPAGEVEAGRPEGPTFECG